MIAKLKRYFLLDCTVFAIMTVVLQLFYRVSGLMDEFAEKSFLDYSNIILQYFAVSTTMAFLFFLCDVIFGNSDRITGHLISLIIVVGTVFLEGGLLFKWFNVASIYTLWVLLIIAIIYCLVWFLCFAKDVDDSKQINKKITEMQENEDE